MITSDFTLEQSLTSESKLNVARLPMQPQLQRLHVKENEWTSIYDYAAGVVERAATREALKRELDAQLTTQLGHVVVSFSGKRNKEREKKRTEIATAKAEHDRNTNKGWTVLLNKCNSTLGGYGVSAYLMIDQKAKTHYGIEFRCLPARLQPNKLELRYDPRRAMWTWPRDKVPDEIAALHVDANSWKAVWDKADSTLKKVRSMEEKEREVQKKMNDIDAGMSVLMGDYYDNQAVSKAIVKATSLVEEKHNVKYEKEVEWGKLLDFADDVFFMFGASTKLMRHAELMHCGLVFRFQPIVATTTVPAVATASATPVASAPVL